MRLFAFLFLLFALALALASCGRVKGVENTNSAEPFAGHAGKTSRRSCVNLNTAAAEELGRLPGIGQVTARKIIEYREQNGSFRRPEEIIIIDGFSERKYRAIAEMICVE